MGAPSPDLQPTAPLAVWPVMTSGELQCLCFSSNHCLWDLVGSHDVYLQHVDCWDASLSWNLQQQKMRMFNASLKCITAQLVFVIFFFLVRFLLLRFNARFLFSQEKLGLLKPGFQHDTSNSTAKKWIFASAVMKDFWVLVCTVKFFILTGSQHSHLT